MVDRSSSACVDLRRSARPPKPSTAGITLVRATPSMASMTDSWTVMVGKRAASWKERIRPSRARTSGRVRLTSFPSKCTEPRSWRVKPPRTSNNVVLPAPFGPIRPRISPERTSRSTASTAVRPPKRLVSSLATRTVSPARCGCTPLLGETANPTAASIPPPGVTMRSATGSRPARRASVSTTTSRSGASP